VSGGTWAIEFEPGTITILLFDAFSKENRYFGTQLSLNWKNRNTSRQAELLIVKGAFLRIDQRVIGEREQRKFASCL